MQKNNYATHLICVIFSEKKRCKQMQQEWIYIISDLSSGLYCVDVCSTYSHCNSKITCPSNCWIYSNITYPGLTTASSSASTTASTLTTTASSTSTSTTFYLKTVNYSNSLNYIDSLNCTGADIGNTCETLTYIHCKNIPSNWRRFTMKFNGESL